MCQEIIALEYCNFLGRVVKRVEEITIAVQAVKGGLKSGKVTKKAGKLRGKLHGFMNVEY